MARDSPQNHLFQPEEAQVFFRWRLGLPLSPAPPLLCPAYHCPQDPFGDHTQCCGKAGSFGRHNAVRNSVGESLLDSGFQVRREAPREQHKVDVSELLRPAYLLLGYFGPAPLALDFSVVHPLHFNASLAEVASGSAAEKACQRKGS